MQPRLKQLTLVDILLGLSIISMIIVLVIPFVIH